MAGRTSPAEIKAGGTVHGVFTQLCNLAMGVPRAILLYLCGAALCLTGTQTSESNEKGWLVVSWVWGRRAWGCGLLDLRKEQVGTWIPGSGGGGAGTRTPGNWSVKGIETVSSSFLFPISHFLWCHFLSSCHFGLSHPPHRGPQSRVLLGNHEGSL